VLLRQPEPVERREGAESLRPTAERILDTAEDAFAEKGYDATSLGDIASRVGISGPGIYKHFKNKRDLYEAVLARLIDPFFQMMEEKIDDPDERPEVLQVVRTVLLHHVQHPNLARLVQHATLAGGTQIELLVERWYRPIFMRAQSQLFGGVSASRLPESKVRTAIMSFHSMILGYITLARLHADTLDCDPLSDAEVERFYEMICLITQDLRP
jgi:TetR/AcrR family transcriptional regulator